MSLPASYARWLEALIGAPVPIETRATCHACAQCVPRMPASQAFRPDVRCCTYIPRLPNYAIGRLLAEEANADTAEGLASVRRRLAGGEAIDPLGLEVTQVDLAAYDRLLANDAFGRDPDVTCPHLLKDGRCGVWRHRNGVCATWFCRHDRGAVGDAFWDAAQKWLTALEHRVGLWAAEVVFFAGRRTVDPEALTRGDWGGWNIDRETFYRATAVAVDGLDWTGVARVAGDRLDDEAQAVRAAFEPMRRPEYPRRFEVSPLQILDEEGGVARVQGYSDTDWVEVPSALLPMLEALDGARLVDIREALAKRHIPIEPGTLEALVDQEVLVPLREH